MARLQILELPEGTEDDRPPFVLVVDQCEPRRYITGLDQPEPVNEFDGIAERIGARGVIVTPETVDIPANETFVQTEPLLRAGEFPNSDEAQRTAKERDELHAELGLASGQLHSAALAAIRGKHANIRELIKRAEQTEADRDEARTWARHGYETGQPVGPDGQPLFQAQIDHSIEEATADLVSAINRADERTDIARLRAELDRLRGESTKPDA
ncbi:hypothetical protein [Streptomyces sp. H27-D2]|uniref:hypothetical protein n=1 Tax=Streptomyces sp. H27-D2 TaxID=3046304 RepID=UPI002DBC897D|nr:hypothetical protein [Streptomyces sp. H27-D2]MEC4016111.1 hypothetical protein [Streptomyces sp. H27-D2]